MIKEAEYAGTKVHLLSSRAISTPEVDPLRLGLVRQKPSASVPFLLRIIWHLQQRANGKSFLLERPMPFRSRRKNCWIIFNSKWLDRPFWLTRSWHYSFLCFAYDMHHYIHCNLFNYINLGLEYLCALSQRAQRGQSGARNLKNERHRWPVALPRNRCSSHVGLFGSLVSPKC